MDDKQFFEFYIPALENAILNDQTNYGYLVHGPDWFIEHEGIRNEMDLFEQENYRKYNPIFDLVSLYFDAKSHNFDEIDGIDISTYRLNLIKVINDYKKKFSLK
jgi:hypothetical protein